MIVYDALKLITSTPEWLKVEETLEKYLTDMFDLRNIDAKLPAEDYKIECLSRLRAAENVHLFYKNNKFINKRLDEVKTSFR